MTQSVFCVRAATSAFGFRRDVGGAADHSAIKWAGRSAMTAGSKQSRCAPESIRNVELKLGRKHFLWKSTARDIVIALIIDDGPAQKTSAEHLQSGLQCAGAAYGPHARYRSVCSIDFAGGYTERGSDCSAKISEL